MIEEDLSVARKNKPNLAADDRARGPIRRLAVPETSSRPAGYPDASLCYHSTLPVAAFRAKQTQFGLSRRRAKCRMEKGLQTIRDGAGPGKQSQCGKCQTVMSSKQVGACCLRIVSISSQALRISHWALGDRRSWKM